MLNKCEVLSQGPSPDNGAAERAEVAGQPKVLKNKVTMTEKPDGAHNMIGDRTAGSVGEISSELPHREGIGVHARKSRRANRRKSERP